MKLFLIFATWLTVTYGTVPPNLFETKCPRRGPNVSPCLLKTIDRFRPYFNEGIPELNIPRLEPFNMREFKMDAEIPGAVIKGEATNIIAHGGSDFVIKSLKFVLDSDFCYFVVVVYIPVLLISCDYDTTGSKIYDIETSGSGHMSVAFKNVTASVRTSGNLFKRNGLDYIKLGNLITEVDLGESVLDIDPDDKSETAQNAALFMGIGSSEVFKLLKPIINKAAAPIVKRYLTKIFNVVTINDLFVPFKDL